VTIHALPEPNLGQDRYVFPGSSILLSPGDFYGYDWNHSGSTASEVRISESGTYNVTVEDINCCKSSDTVDIVFVPLTVPTAIRPQSDIVENRSFMMTGMIEGLSNFEMYIYNRWGQLLFETENRAEGWDGTFNGEMVQTGTYTYVIRFVITDEEMNERDILRKGTVVVLN
jgi:gliding motility-associated-like protein